MRRPAVAIVGLGLIGGSLARALTRAGYRVIGVDRADVRRRARAAGAVAQTVATPEQAAALADVVVLAAPPRTNLALLRRLAEEGPRLVVTDVGSVKGAICGEARRRGWRWFVGGHPMAGNEGQGFGAGSAQLFQGRPWALVPTPGGGEALARVRALVQAVGGRPRILSAGEHDRVVAFLSHLPQLLAYALQEAAGRDRRAARHLPLAGPGFKDMTRLARSPRPLWREILEENHAAVEHALLAFRRALRASPPRRQRRGGS